jgi:hypothetical protein
MDLRDRLSYHRNAAFQESHHNSLDLNSYTKTRKKETKCKHAGTHFPAPFAATLNSRSRL